MKVLLGLVILTASLFSQARELDYPLNKYVTAEQLAKIEKDIRENRSKTETVFVDSRNQDECQKAMLSFKQRGWPVADNMCDPSKSTPIVAVQVNKLEVTTSITALRCSAKESGNYTLKSLMEEYCPYLMFTVIFN